MVLGLESDNPAPNPVDLTGMMVVFIHVCCRCLTILHNTLVPVSAASRRMISG